MTFPPPPPAPPPLPGARQVPERKASSPLIPLLIVGTIGMIVLAAAIVAGAIILTRRPAPSVAEDRPPIEAPVPPPAEPRPEPPPAAVSEPISEPPPERPVRSTPPRPKPRGDALGSALGGLPDAPPPPPPRMPIRSGGSIPIPTKLRNVSPVYPEIAQRARIQGAVIIEATIGTDGKVTNAKVLRSIPLLDQAALDAVQQWEYTPTLLNGVAVPVIVTVTVNFRLQ